MARIFAAYLEKAKKILDDNWLGSSTKPAPSLYPPRSLFSGNPESFHKGLDSGLKTAGMMTIEVINISTIKHTLSNGHWH